MFIFIFCILMLIPNSWAKETISPSTYSFPPAEFQRRKHAFDAWQARQPALSLVLDHASAKWSPALSTLTQWEKDAKHSSLLPQLLLGYDRDLDEKSAIVIEDTVSVTSNDIVVGPPESQENYNINTGQTIRVRLQWDFAPLIYHRDQLALNRERRSISQSRLELSEKVRAAYEKRNELALQAFFSPNDMERLSSQTQQRTLEDWLTAISGIAFPE